VERTRLAHERTLMAWVRTAVSLISFGFTIYKLFQFELKGQAVPPGRLVGPPQFALMMIAIGLVALVVATTGYRRSMRAMRAEFGHVPIWTATVVAALVSLLGIVAFVAVMFRA
jgi:putative membrane protein